MAPNNGDEYTNSGLDAHWNEFDYNNSQFGFNKDGSKRSWGQLIKQYPLLKNGLRIMLGEWAEKQEEAGLTTTGVKMDLPPPEKSENSQTMSLTFS
jgi:hypothetical protein